MNSLSLHVLVCLCLLLLTSCGGGGGGSTSGGSTGGNGNSGGTGGGTQNGVQVANGNLVVTTNAMQITFQGDLVQSLRNTLTGETLIGAPGPGMLDLNLQNATGELLAPQAWTVRNDVGHLAAIDSKRTVNFNVGWDPSTDEVIIKLDGKATVPGVRGLLWAIQGFDPKGRFIIPAHSGIYFDSNANPSQFYFQYPTHWEAQFIIYESAKGGVLLYARDPRPYFKHIQGTREFGTLDLAFETYAFAPWEAASEVPVTEWRLKAFQGSWRNAVDAYKKWSSTVWPTRSPDPRRDWVNNVNVVMTVIDPQTSFLDEIAKQFDPAKTLIYFVNWRKDGFDVNYPDYTPKTEAASFIQYAHSLGFHVMLHTNALGVALYNSAFDNVSQFQLRDPNTKELILWPWGLWPAGPPPPPYLQSYAFISPASTAYRTLFMQQIKPMMDQLQPDAIHVDAGGVLLNDGNGLIEGMTTIEGMIQLHKDITSTYPQVALSYESMTESLTGFHSFAQRWNAEFPAHPVCTYLMGDHMKFYGFLDQPNPDQPRFIDYIKRYEAQGIMPTITVAHDYDLSTSQPVTASVIKMMKLWQQYDFEPDWNADWTGSLFRYISKDGNTKAWTSEKDNIVSLQAAGETVYERAHDVNSIATSASIEDWTAFDTSRLYGLDPSLEYWLRTDLPRDSALVRLSDLPDGVKLELGTLATSSYGYFELDRIQKQPYDFYQQFWAAKTGVQGLVDHPLGSGAVAQVTQGTIAGKTRNPLIVMLPPFGTWLGGATFVEYDVPVATAPSTLSFNVGMSDYATLSDGVLFKVTVNGTQMIREAVHLNEWTPYKVDLSQWSGQTVKIRFAVHPGPNLNPVDDIFAIGDLAITSKPVPDNVNFSAVMPDNSYSPTASGGIVLTPSGTSQYSIQTQLPVQFAVFGKKPPALALGQSLLSLPFDIWQKGSGGFAVPSKFQETGNIRSVSSGTVSKIAIGTWPADRSESMVTTTVHIPADATTLTFSVGLSDAPPPLASVPYSGVEFSMLINGKSVFDHLYQIQGWNDQSIDLTPYRDQDVVITLVGDSNGSGIYDWGNWADLTIH